MKRRREGRGNGTRYSKIRKFTSCVLIFYCIMLILHSAALCFADEKMLEGKIMGTGPGKVWLSLGSNQGATEGMLFEVRHDDVVIGKVKIKKVGASSSEAEIVESANGDVKIYPGDMVKWMLPMDLLEEKEEKTPKKIEQKTEPVTNEDKKENAPSTPTSVETKSDEDSNEEQKEDEKFHKEVEKYHKEVEGKIKKQQHCEALTKKLNGLGNQSSQKRYWNPQTKTYIYFSTPDLKRQKILDEMSQMGCYY